jgi:endonuclease/exonuclease/phosphatase family metal-dependent hydrolase
VKVSVASYNLFDGSSDAYARLVRFASEQKFDVLCLQEVNGWQDKDQARLRDFLDQAGYTEYAYGNSNTEQNLATFSRLPIKSQEMHVIGFWHGAVEIHVDIGGVEVVIFNVHLNPWNEDSRLQEVDHLLPKMDLSKPTIVTGDFNSLSRQDGYPPEFHAELIKAGIMKYGQVELDFRVMDTFMNMGLIDVAAALGAMQATVPTPRANDKEHELPVRIDYMLVSPQLQNAVTDISVIQSGETDVISDHYPIGMKLGIGGEAEPEPDAVPTQQESAPQPAATAESEPRNTNTEGEINLH